MRRFGEARNHIRRLERILADDAEAEAAIGDVDLNAFWPRRSFALAQLKPHLSPASPAFRYAARLALAMMAGGVVALSLGYEGHGNWVMLTIAVILRPSYGLTRQRRDQRLDRDADRLRAGRGGRRLSPGRRAHRLAGDLANADPCLRPPQLLARLDRRFDDGVDFAAFGLPSGVRAGADAASSPR